MNKYISYKLVLEWKVYESVGLRFFVTDYEFDKLSHGKVVHTSNHNGDNRDNDVENHQNEQVTKEYFDKRFMGFTKKLVKDLR